MDISSYEILDEPDPIKAGHIAVQLVHHGKIRYVYERFNKYKRFL